MTIDLSHFSKPSLSYGEMVDPITSITSETDAANYLDAWVRFLIRQAPFGSEYQTRTYCLLAIATNIRFFQREWDTPTSDRVQKLFVLPIAAEIYETVAGAKPS